MKNYQERLNRIKRATEFGFTKYNAEGKTIPNELKTPREEATEEENRETNA